MSNVVQFPGKNIGREREQAIRAAKREFARAMKCHRRGDEWAAAGILGDMVNSLGYHTVVDRYGLEEAWEFFQQDEARKDGRPLDTGHGLRLPLSWDEEPTAG